LHLEPPDGSSETGFSLQERAIREGDINGKIFEEGEQGPCGKRLLVE